MAKPLLGEMLVENGVITQEQLNKALEVQHSEGGLIGIILVSQGIISEQKLKKRFLFVLKIIGVDITVLMASLAALLVGLGFGLQNLFSDYMSGIIILFDSSIKVNDVIDVNGTVGQVIKIGLRTTTVKTRSDQYIILPNTKLTSTELINWTHQAGSTRFEINIGVDYSSDIHLVMKLLKKAAIDQDGVLNSPEPFVRFNEYGDSALLFSLYFWADEVFRVENIKSQLRIRLFDVFKSNGINIPFPQRVLYIKQDEKDKLPE